MPARADSAKGGPTKEVVYTHTRPVLTKPKPVGKIGKKQKPKKPGSRKLSPQNGAIPFGAVKINGEIVYLFINGVLSNNDYLQDTNKALELAPQLIEKKKSGEEVTDEEYAELQRLIIVTKQGRQFSPLTLNTQAEIHYKQALEALEWALEEIF